MIRYGPASVYHRVPLRICSNSWAHDKSFMVQSNASRSARSRWRTGGNSSMALRFFDRRRRRGETRGKKRRAQCMHEGAKRKIPQGRAGARSWSWWSAKGRRSRIEVGNGDRFISMVLKLSEKRRASQARHLTERGVAKPDGKFIGM
jgi:hypothetical protein